MRRVTPALIAQEIIGVQPMAPLVKKGYTTGIDYVGEEDPFAVQWYWVQLSSPFIFSIKFNKVPPLTNMGEWCKETFGDDQVTWKTHLSRYSFKEEEMRTMFILRWADEL